LTAADRPEGYRPDLTGQSVVITGGSSGIGCATAEAALEAGAARVVLAARDPSRLEAARAALGDRAEPHVLDVTDEAAAAAAFAAIGTFDHLVTAAAGTYRGRIAQTDTAAARALFEAKYWGQHHCLKHAAGRVRCSVTLFSGWISRKPMEGTATLAAIDAAIEALARVASLELAPVRVNAVTPGMIDTPLWGARLSAAAQRAHFERVGAALPVGRAGTARDVAQAVLFLMTNGFVTGAVLDVDGGQR
jgi:NAD(P)-dependent dehydrogenase (short-subunit alcohol dehydrogenase family)